MINEIFAFLVRDGFNLIILILLNILIFMRVKQGMNKKILMLNKVNTTMQRQNGQNDHKSPPPGTHIEENAHDEADQQQRRRTTNNSHKSTRSISKTKYKLTIMVIMSSVNCTLGRLPIMIFFIIRNFSENDAVLYFRKLAVMCVYLSYDFNFLFLYFTNKKFKMLFNEYFLVLLTCHRRILLVMDMQ